MRLFLLILFYLPFALSNAQETQTFYYNSEGVEVDSVDNYTTFEFCEVNQMKIKDGKCDVFTKSDKLVETFNYLDGVKEGNYYRYFPQQTPMITGHYENNKKTGNWVIYDSKGIPKALYKYENDSLIKQASWTELSKAEKEKTLIIKPLATFEGGGKAWMQFMASTLKYPNEAKMRRVQGRVLVSFSIDKKGKINNIEIQESPSDILSDEVYRLIEKSPKWEPANVDGKNIESQLSLAITFQLKGESWLRENKN